MNTFILQPIPENMIPWLYSADAETDKVRQCIGHMRGYFDGQVFRHSWFPHVDELRSEEFRAEFSMIVHELRRKDMLLHDFATMCRQCRCGTPLNDGLDSTGAVIVTDRFLYAIRCTPMRGDYNVYIYCYDREDRKGEAQ